MFRRYLFYFCGQLGLMLQARFFFQWIIDFVGGGTSGVLILSGASVGFLLLGFRIFDAITDPLSGMLSDYMVSKGRKRSDLMLYAAPLLPIGLILSFSLSTQYSSSFNWLIISIGFFIFFIAYTLYCIPYWSLIEDFGDNDPVIKTRLSSLLGQGLFVATAIGFVITPLLISSFGYFHSSLIIGVCSFPLLLLPVFSGFKEIAKRSLGIDSNKTNFSFYLLLDNLLKPLREKHFLAVILYFVGSQMAFTVLTASAPLYVRYVLGAETSFISLMMGPVILLAVITFIILPKILKDDNDWSRYLHFASVSLGLVYMIASFIDAPLLFSSQTQAIMVFALVGPILGIILGVEGYGITVTAKNPARMGMYFGSFNFVVKGMNGVAIWATGIASDMALSTSSGVSIKYLLFIAGVGVLVFSFLGRYLLRDYVTMKNKNE